MRGRGRRGRKRRKKDARDGGGGRRRGGGRAMARGCLRKQCCILGSSLSLLGVVPCEPSRWVGRTRTC